jgi:hypothetical protein
MLGLQIGGLEEFDQQALCCKPQSRGFDYRCLWIWNGPNPSSRTMALGSTRPLTEMSIRNLSGGKGRSARKADLTSTVNRLHRKYVSLDVWQHGPPRPVTRIALYLFIKFWKPRCLFDEPSYQHYPRTLVKEEAATRNYNEDMKGCEEIQCLMS